MTKIRFLSAAQTPEPINISDGTLNILEQDTES